MSDAKGDIGVGDRLRALRRERRLSLAAVAATVGISASFLSQVETGKVHPSVATLLSIANLFGVSLDDLFGRSVRETAGRTRERVEPVPSEPATGPGGVVINVDSAPTIELENGVTWTRLSDGGGALASSLLVTYEPGGRDTVDGRLKRHAAWEYGYLLEGRLQLKLEFDVIELVAGDSFHFDSDRPHLFENTSTAPARGVWFVLHKRDAVTVDPDGIDRRATPRP